MKFKIIILLVVFGVCIQRLPAQVCSNPLNIIYGLDQKGNIVPITVSNASVGTTITSSGDVGYPGSTSNSNAIGLSIQTKTFYFFQNNSAGSQVFVSFNSVTNKYTTLANSPISGSVVKGCVTADGTGYYCIDASGELCYYNIASNTWTKINTSVVDQFGNNLASIFSTEGSGDIAIDGLGRLWIVVSSSSQWGLYELNAPLPTTNITTLTLNQMVAPTQSTPISSPFGGIAYNATGQIYMSTVNNLYLLNSNLSITLVGSFSSSGVGADLTSCNYPLSVLPVSWASFSASLQNNNSVLLAWSINQQLNNAGYNVQRSQDAEAWENIGFRGNTPGEGIINYSFTDTSPNSGTNYYRIQALDIDGNISYSEIKAVNIQSNGSVNIWPIPALSSVKIEIPGSPGSPGGSVQIFTPSGQLVASHALNGGINTVDISSLLVGNYVVHLTLINGSTVNQKLVKL